MGDERAQETTECEVVQESPRKPGRGRAGVIALVVVLVLLAAGTGYLVGNDRTAPAASTAVAADPVATLDAALAEGRPAYVLIHSLT